ncbi:MAG: PepSY-like domain-containing protein, partial [Limisphaerales bacterium]
MNKNIYAAIAALSLAIGTSAEDVNFSQLPSAAQKSINRHLYGGVVQEIDRKTEAGRTIYDVEIRREGKNRHLRVDADGKLLAASKVGNASVDVDVDDGGAFDKNDGKILGVIDNPRDKDDFKAEARVGDDGVAVEADVDKPRDRGITEDVFDKNDGKILNVLPAPGARDNARVETAVDLDTDKDASIKADVDVDTDDKDVVVEANTDEDKGIFRKDDGKILGIPVPGRNADKNADVAVEVDSNKNHVTTEVDGGLDTDKNDGRILGVPKRGFETISLNEVPPVVRETIRREAGGYKVAEIEKAILNGRQVYEVDIERDGKNRELHVATDGTIIKDTDREAVGAPRNNRTRP